MTMSLGEKIEFLWNKALDDAMGAGEPDPWSYADAKVAHLVAELPPYKEPEPKPYDPFAPLDRRPRLNSEDEWRGL